MSAFATIAQLEAYWKVLTDPEKDRAQVMLDLSSDRLRVIADSVGVDIDAKVAASTAYASVARWVTMEATKRAMLTPLDEGPVGERSITAGPYSENYKYSNPSGDLWFKKTELASLGIYGNQKLGSIATTSNGMYEEWPSS